MFNGNSEADQQVSREKSAVHTDDPSAKKTMSKNEVTKMKVVDLKAELSQRKLPTYGKKCDLVARLQAAITLERDIQEGNDEVEAIDDDDDDNDYDNDDDVVNDEAEEITTRQREDISVMLDNNLNIEETPRARVPSNMPRRPRYDASRRAMLTFRDVEDSLEKFSGDDHLDIKQWLRNIEELAEIYGWTDLMKLAYTRRLLSGSAQLFVEYERCARTWDGLKTALIDEFGDKVDSFQVHRELHERKKRADETYQQYVYQMVKIAAQADVDTAAVIQYIIQGIKDEAANKNYLYEARTIKELRDRLKRYEKTKQEVQSKNKPIDKKDFRGSVKKITQTATSEKQRRCFNCGETGHVSTVCPVKDKGAKCFKCSGYGHIAAKCPKKEEVNLTSTRSKKKLEKEVMINNHTFKALIDTGSDLTLIRTDEYVMLGSPRLSSLRIKFEGIGASCYETMGDFCAVMLVDGQEHIVNLHVVPSNVSKHPVILGKDFIDQVDLRVKRGEITIGKIVDEDNDENIPEILKIDVVDGSDTVNVDYIKEPEYREEIKKMITNYTPVNECDVGVKTRIILKDNIPVAARPRRLSPAEKEDVEQIMKQWLEDGIIQPSNSEYASPIVLVKKKDGSTRVCVDYRALNKKIERPRFPLPLIEDQLDQLQDVEVFSTLDLKNGFFHVPVDKESQRYTAFVTPNNQYEFLKTPFGLCVAPAVFQKFIYAVFKELIRGKIVVVYMDDVIVLAKNKDEALRRVQQVVKVAERHGLTINWAKCKFLQTEIEYLGHIVSRGTVRPSENKTKAVQNFPTPVNVKNVQSFLGLTGYFRKFIPRYAFIAKPLTDLLKKNNKFQFGPREAEAFGLLKAALSGDPVLKIYRVGAETELHTDASHLGYGMIVMQRDDVDLKFHPVYFASGKTTSAEEKYASYELEVLAIVNALKKFRVYLLGIKFKIITDCQAFALTMRKKDLSARVARWALQLEEFDYEVCHRSGNSMKHVDALSRNPLPCVMLTNECEDSVMARLKSAQKTDPELCKVMSEVQQDKLNGYVLRDGLLCKETNGEIVIVVPKSMQSQVIRMTHERGHFGANKTEALIREDYWFKDMRPKILKVIASCLNCILAERKQGKQEGLLQPISKGDVPLDTFHIDHVGPMTTTKKGYQHLLVVVDAFTKFVWLYPTRSTNTAEVINRLSKQSTIFGNPRRIVSDRGTAFTSKAFEEYCREQNIKHVLITTGLPRANGQVERVNRTLIPLLTKLASPTPENWYRYVDAAQKWLNAVPSRSTKYTPFHLLFGVNVRLKEDIRIKEMLDEEWRARFTEQRDDLRQVAKENLLKIQEENRRNFNKNRKESNEYAVGDLVAIKRTQFGPGLKLRGKFLGPYRITKVKRNGGYMVNKLGIHEGPAVSSSTAEFMKPWLNGENDSASSQEEDI